MGRIQNAVKALLGVNPPIKRELYAIPKMVESEKKLDGKIALIIGATGGIGKELAETFIKNGSKVILAARDLNKLNALASNLQEKYGEVCRSCKIDVTDIDSMGNAFENVLSLFEEKRIDILVNASGVNTQTRFWDFKEDEFDRILDINLKGVFFACQYVANYMRKNGIKGHILNVSSASALRPAWTPYEISKWSINGFTRGLADLCLPYGIIVNAIAPGPVATEMLGKSEADNLINENNVSGRYAVPSEIAELATYMVSDFGNLIVGETFYITGGSGLITLHR